MQALIEPQVIRWKLKVVMADRDMSVNELAQRLNVHRVTISKWRNSQGIPQFENTDGTLNALCNTLRCAPSDLMEHTPDSETKESQD